MSLLLSRRQALKSGLVGILSAYIPSRLAYTSTVQLDLSLFCAADSEDEYETRRPWIDAGYRYATDCAICVRAKSLESDTLVPSVGLSFPDCSKLPWDEIQRVFMWKPWPTQPPKGTGVSQHYAVEVDGSLVQNCYNKLLRQLPNLHYSLARKTELGEVFLLRFQGGEILLMPMDP